MALQDVEHLRAQERLPLVGRELDPMAMTEQHLNLHGMGPPLEDGFGQPRANGVPDSGIRRWQQFVEDSHRAALERERQVAGPSTQQNPRRESVAISPTSVQPAGWGYYPSIGNGTEEYHRDLQAQHNSYRNGVTNYLAQQRHEEYLREQQRLANGGAPVIVSTEAYHRNQVIRSEQLRRASERSCFPQRNPVNMKANRYSRPRRPWFRFPVAQAQQLPQVDLPGFVEVQDRLRTSQQLRPGRSSSLPRPSEGMRQAVRTSLEGVDLPNTQESRQQLAARRPVSQPPRTSPPGPSEPVRHAVRASLAELPNELLECAGTRPSVTQERRANSAAPQPDADRQRIVVQQRRDTVAPRAASEDLGTIKQLDRRAAEEDRAEEEVDG